jgi:phi13 family phage major tail protein
MEYNEYRGIRSLVFAEVTKDDTDSYEVEAWEELSGVQAVAVAKNESSESHFYDNAARIVIDAEGADELTLTVSVLANKTRAKLDGVEYDEATDMIINTPKKRKYFALGYIGEKTDGTEEFNIFYKGKFSGGGETHNTKDDGTEATNVEYTFTGVHTSAKILTLADGTKKTVKSAKFPASATVTEAKVFGTFAEGVSEVSPMSPDEIKALAKA